MYYFRNSLVGIALTSFLTACGGGGSPDGPTTGTLSISLTDAPIDDVYMVNVQLSGVSIKPQIGPAITYDFNPALDIDLLSLQNGNAVTLLNGETVDAGRYEWLELHANAVAGVSDSWAMETSTGGEIELEVPSGSARLVSGFVITAGQNNTFMLDWDTRKGLTDPMGPGGWHLTPALRLIDMTEYGSLSGTVADALTMGDCSSDAEGNVVYVYAGHNATVDDMGSANSPLATAPVKVDEDMAGAYRYTLHYLDPGQYTVAFTCQGLDDNPNADEVGVNEIAFAGWVNGDVATGQGTRNEAPTIQ